LYRIHIYGLVQFVRVHYVGRRHVGQRVSYNLSRGTYLFTSVGHVAGILAMDLYICVLSLFKRKISDFDGATFVTIVK
jgi:hypothetical protein